MREVVFSLKQRINAIAWCLEMFVLYFGDDEK